MSHYSYIIDRFQDLWYNSAVKQLESTPISNWLSNPTIISALGDIIYRLLDIRGVLKVYPHFDRKNTQAVGTPQFQSNLCQLLVDLGSPYITLFTSVDEMLNDPDGIGLCLDFLTSELQYELLHRFRIFESPSAQRSYTISEGVEGDNTTLVQHSNDIDLHLDTSRPSLLSYLLITLNNMHTILYNIDIHHHIEQGDETALPANHYKFSLPPSQQVNLVEAKVDSYLQHILNKNPSLLEKFNSAREENRLFTDEYLSLDNTRRSILRDLCSQLFNDYLARRTVVLQKMTVMTQTFLFSIKYHYLKKNQKHSTVSSKKPSKHNILPLSSDVVGELVVTDPEYVDTIARLKDRFSEVIRQMTYTYPATILDCVFLTNFHPLLLTNSNLRMLSRSRHKSKLMSSHPKLHIIHKMGDRGGRLDSVSDE